MKSVTLIIVFVLGGLVFLNLNITKQKEIDKVCLEDLNLQLVGLIDTIDEGNNYHGYGIIRLKIISSNIKDYDPRSKQEYYFCIIKNGMAEIYDHTPTKLKQDTLIYNTKLKLTVAKYYTPSGRCIQRLDYAHRAATGEVTAVSDSLVKAFTTRNGRTVFDGRGVRPDVEVLNSDTSHILGALVGHWVIFDWATEYRNKHEQIDSSKFELSDVDFAQFAAFAANKDFEYETYTEVLFREMEQAAKSENYFVGSEKEFEVLKNKIKPDKRTDISRFESSIRPIIENEIYSRYYFQNGRIRYGLKEDPSLLKAREVFDRQYAVILKAPSTGK